MEGQLKIQELNGSGKVNSKTLIVTVVSFGNPIA